MAQISFQILNIELHGLRRAVAGDDFARGFAGKRGDFPFELAHAGFTGVIADEVTQAGVGKFHVGTRQSVFFQLARDEIALGNL